jgi:hypothetical protein
MAGRGPAPKPKDARTRSNKPTRGEWVDLPAEPYAGPRPHLPRISGGLLASTKKAWELWWRSPVAHMWMESDWPTLQQLVVLYDRVTRALNSGEFFNGFASMQNELRILRDGLGLTEKGRRDFRWQLPDGAEESTGLAVVTEITRARRDPRSKK